MWWDRAAIEGRAWGRGPRFRIFTLSVGAGVDDPIKPFFPQLTRRRQLRFGEGTNAGKDNEDI